MEFSSTACKICNKEHLVFAENTDNLWRKLCMLCRHEIRRTNQFLAQLEKSSAFLLSTAHIIESAVKAEPEDEMGGKNVRLWIDSDKVILGAEPPGAALCTKDSYTFCRQHFTRVDIKIENTNEVNLESKLPGASQFIENNYNFSKKNSPPMEIEYVGVEEDVSNLDSCSSENVFTAHHFKSDDIQEEIRLTPSAIVEEILREDEEESESELSDQGSEISDHIVADEPRSAEESNCSDPEEDDLPLSEINSCFIGRDKVTKWQKSNNNRVRHQVHNILTENKGICRNGFGLTTFTQAWHLFISENIIEKVVIHTNEFIQKKAPSYNRIRDCKPTDAMEIKALFGLLYIAGSLKTSHANLEDLYASDGTDIPIFTTTMSVKRVKFLLNSLRFDDATTRQARRSLDKAAPIREVLDMFTQNCLLPYSVGDNVVIDEMMVAFQGKCPFRQYMKSKPDKYGIKLYPLVDADTFYVLNIELYAGKQPEGPYQFSNAEVDIVKRLITPISGTGRNLTINNWYTSVPLVNDLAKNHKISVVGTMRKNKKEIPPCFIDNNRPEYSSKFGFSDTATLVSYIPKKKRSVVLISSLHCAAEIDDSTNDKRTPSIITFYNKTKGGVDEVDKKAKMYSVSRKNNRWPLTIFFRLLDIAGINSMVILRANNVTLRKRRLYLRALGTELIKEYIQRRSTMLGLPRKLKRNIREHLNMKDSAADTEAGSSGTCRGTCKICPSKKRRQSKTQCKLCTKNICRSHTTFICNQCYLNEETNSDEN